MAMHATKQSRSRSDRELSDCQARVLNAPHPERAGSIGESKELDPHSRCAPNPSERLSTDMARLQLADAAPRCLHIRFSGRRCGSAAMKKRPYCYFHAKQREPQKLRLHLGGLEDASAIQFNIARVLNDLQCGRLTKKDAYLYLLGLQIASSNHKHVEKELEAKDEPVTQSQSELLAAEGWTEEAELARKDEAGEPVGEEKVRHDEGEAHDARIIQQIIDSPVRVEGEEEEDYKMRLRRSTKWMHDQQSSSSDETSSDAESALNAKIFGVPDSDQSDA